MILRTTTGHFLCPILLFPSNHILTHHIARINRVVLCPCNNSRSCDIFNAPTFIVHSAEGTATSLAQRFSIKYKSNSPHVMRCEPNQRTRFPMPLGPDRWCTFDVHFVRPSRRHRACACVAFRAAPAEDRRPTAAMLDYVVDLYQVGELARRLETARRRVAKVN